MLFKTHFVKNFFCLLYGHKPKLSWHSSLIRLKKAFNYGKGSCASYAKSISNWFKTVVLFLCNVIRMLLYARER